MGNDKKKRSLCKGATWRITASLCTMLLVLIFTGSIEFMLAIGALEIISKFILYYAHERIWEHIRWGRINAP